MNTSEQNLFFKNGHLTPAAFELLQQDNLDELSRLEIAEHLAFCDECLMDYTLFLEGAPLTPAPDNFQSGVQQKLRSRWYTVKFVPALKAAACTALAMGIWLTALPKVTAYAMPQGEQQQANLFIAKEAPEFVVQTPPEGQTGKFFVWFDNLIGGCAQNKKDIEPEEQQLQQQQNRRWGNTANPNEENNLKEEKMNNETN